MPTSPEPEQPLMSLDEYIALCANLHNTLIAKSVPPDSEPPETSTISSNATNPTGPTPLSTPTQRPSISRNWIPFLPSPSSCPSSKPPSLPQEVHPPPLTPLLYQPIPDWFFPPQYRHAIDAADSPFLLLYPQRLPSEPCMDGGLFVDAYTLGGIWLQAPPGPGRMPPPEKWLPLDSLLKLELSRWESGRYVHDTEAEEGLKISKWVPVPVPISSSAVPVYYRYPNLQVAEAISEWERLLSAIESKMPSTTTPEATTTDRERGEPLRHEAMQGLPLSEFAKQFLGLAPRPKGWTFVAPGIKTFSEKSLREAYSAEEEHAFRRTSTNWDGGEDWVTLLLPNLIVESVPSADVLSRVPDVDISSFDKPYGFGKATLARRPGLYTTWASERDGDLVQLVCPSGRTNVGVFGGPCPWAPSRAPRLAEMLGHWANLVQNGVWAVGEDGVEEDAGWFDSHVGLANLDWDDGLE